MPGKEAAPLLMRAPLQRAREVLRRMRLRQPSQVLALPTLAFLVNMWLVILSSWYGHVAMVPLPALQWTTVAFMLAWLLIAAIQELSLRVMTRRKQGAFEARKQDRFAGLSFQQLDRLSRAELSASVGQAKSASVRFGRRMSLGAQNLGRRVSQAAPQILRSSSSTIVFDRGSEVYSRVLLYTAALSAAGCMLGLARFLYLLIPGGDGASLEQARRIIEGAPYWFSSLVSLPQIGFVAGFVLFQVFLGFGVCFALCCCWGGRLRRLVQRLTLPRKMDTMPFIDTIQNRVRLTLAAPCIFLFPVAALSSFVIGGTALVDPKRTFVPPGPPTALVPLCAPIVSARVVERGERMILAAAAGAGGITSSDFAAAGRVGVHAAWASTFEPIDDGCLVGGGPFAAVAADYAQTAVDLPAFPLALRDATGRAASAVHAGVANASLALAPAGCAAILGGEASLALPAREGVLAFSRLALRDAGPHCAGEHVIRFGLGALPPLELSVLLVRHNASLVTTSDATMRMAPVVDAADNSTVSGVLEYTRVSTLDLVRTTSVTTITTTPDPLRSSAPPSTVVTTRVTEREPAHVLVFTRPPPAAVAAHEPFVVGLLLVTEAGLPLAGQQVQALLLAEAGSGGRLRPAGAVGYTDSEGAVNLTLVIDSGVGRDYRLVFGSNGTTVADPMRQAGVLIDATQSATELWHRIILPSVAPSDAALSRSALSDTLVDSQSRALQGEAESKLGGAQGCASAAASARALGASADVSSAADCISESTSFAAQSADVGSASDAYAYSAAGDGLLDAMLMASRANGVASLARAVVPQLQGLRRTAGRLGGAVNSAASAANRGDRYAVVQELVTLTLGVGAPPVATINLTADVTAELTAPISGFGLFATARDLPDAVDGPGGWSKGLTPAAANASISPSTCASAGYPNLVPAQATRHAIAAAGAPPLVPMPERGDVYPIGGPMWQAPVVMERNWLLDTHSRYDPSSATTLGMPHWGGIPPLCRASFLAAGQAAPATSARAPAHGHAFADGWFPAFEEVAAWLEGFGGDARAFEAACAPAALAAAGDGPISDPAAAPLGVSASLAAACGYGRGLGFGSNPKRYYSSAPRVVIRSADGTPLAGRNCTLQELGHSLGDMVALRLSYTCGPSDANGVAAIRELRAEAGSTRALSFTAAVEGVPAPLSNRSHWGADTTLYYINPDQMSLSSIGLLSLKGHDALYLLSLLAIPLFAINTVGYRAERPSRIWRFLAGFATSWLAFVSTSLFVRTFKPAAAAGGGGARPAVLSAVGLNDLTAFRPGQVDTFAASIGIFSLALTVVIALIVSALSSDLEVREFFEKICFVGLGQSPELRPLQQSLRATRALAAAVFASCTEYSVL